MVVRQSVKMTMIVLNVLFALALLFGKLTTIVSPAHWLMFAYFGLIFPFVLFVNFLFMVFWIVLHKWKILFISLTASLICLNNICNTFPIHLIKSDNDPKATHLKIMSYNIDAFGQFTPSKKNTMDGLLGYINKMQPDVVCMQEFYVYVKGRILTEQNVLKKMRNYPYHYIYYSAISDAFSEGLAIFSKYPIDFKGVCQFSKGYYTTIYADIIVNSKTIRVFDHHMESYKFSSSERKHYEDLVDDFSAQQFHDVVLKFSTKMNEAYGVRARQADTVAKTIAKSPYPVIVCGDFNDVPVSYTYTTIKKDLIDTYVAAGTGYGNTYSHKLFPFRIDYIMVDPGFHTLGSKVYHVKHSDHYPIMSQVAIE
jgi:endonuclease/exonuclease/phosphatase family metal-dependent hydrolase